MARKKSKKHEYVGKLYGELIKDKGDKHVRITKIGEKEFARTCDSIETRMNVELSDEGLTFETRTQTYPDFLENDGTPMKITEKFYPDSELLKAKILRIYFG
jgi:hypothetical protein